MSLTKIHPGLQITVQGLMDLEEAQSLKITYIVKWRIYVGMCVCSVVLHQIVKEPTKA